MHALSLHSVVPVRTEAREGAEQSTQMLFGETCTILEQKPRWNRVKLDLDGQEGWVDEKMISPMKPEEYASYRTDYQTAAYVRLPMTYAVSENNGQTLPLSAGTRLTRYANGRFEVLGVGFRIDAGMVTEQALEMSSENLLQTVRFFLNVPYLWGGKNAMGMDCSGFTQTIMGLFGKTLLRNASEQASQGCAIPDLSHAQAGDLVFFGHDKPAADSRQPIAITHVGILLDPERVIHCSGRVKVEKIDETGIFSVERADAEHPHGQYTHHLAGIRRM